MSPFIHQVMSTPELKEKYEWTIKEYDSNRSQITAKSLSSFWSNPNPK